MKNKNFYTLDEVGHDLSASDIHYAIQNRTLVFSFFIPEAQYIAVQPNSEGKVGQCTLSYEGVVSLGQDDSIKLLHAKSLKVNSLKLANRANATVYSDSYPFRLELPNSYMKAWCPRKLGDMPETDIEVVLLGKEVTDEKAYLRDVFKFQQVPKNAPITIKHNSISINVADAILRRDHLIQASLLDIPEGAVALSERELHLESVRTTQFHELLAELLKAHPKLSKKHCEKILRQERELLKEEREFDRKGIIVDISDTELVWESSYGNRQTIKLSSLGTILSKVRKKINAV